MKFSAYIVNQLVSGDKPYVVYSRMRGRLGEFSDLYAARHFWEQDLAAYAERGHQSDALVYEWLCDRWTLCGTLYDQPDFKPESHPAYSI